MTIVLVFLLGTGGLLIVSALENTSIAATFTSILSGSIIDTSGNAGATPLPTLPGIAGIQQSLTTISDTLHAIVVGASTIKVPGPTSGSATTPTNKNPHNPLGAVEVGTTAGFVQNGAVIGAPSDAVFSRGAGTFLTEWGNRIGGGIATCIETSAEIVRSIEKGTPLSFSVVDANVAALQARGQASSTGVTTWRAEADQLTREGLSNTYYTALNLTALKASINKHNPLVLGFSNATVLIDTFTGKRYDAGVFGHSIAVEGYDSSGIYAADPNTPGGSALVHYTWSNLNAAHVVAMIIPK